MSWHDANRPVTTGEGRALPARSAQAVRTGTILVGVGVMAALAGACTSSKAGDDGTGPTTNGSGTGVLASASPPAWLSVDGERLAPLPPHVITMTDNFSTHDVCAQCHSAGDGKLRDAKNRDVSPVGTWKASPMALAARDPYYLASFADELATRPSLNLTIERTCSRCHAPEAAAQLELSGEATAPGFATLTTDTTKIGNLAREGIGCTGCHQIDATGLGTAASFTGKFTINPDRQIFGPYSDPHGDFMKTVASFTPTYGAHIQKSALCATCHTVITKPRDAKGNAGGDFPEQVPYLEWRASSFVNEGPVKGEKAADCQDCHMPAADDDGVTLQLAVAKAPADLAPRKPFWRHGFAGANHLLSRFGASDPTWFGADVVKEEHEAQATAAENNLHAAAALRIGDVVRTAQGLEIPVEVTNLSGHKFPTGYPSRRAFLHVKVSAGGRTTFESGRVDGYGRFVAASPEGDRLVEPKPSFPHLDVVDRQELVQVYESVPVTATGAPAHRPLDCVKYAKDNRLLPHGFDRKNPYASYTASVGIDSDANWGTSDTVRYRVADAPPGATIEVELLFQVVRPSDIDALADKPTPAARRLFDFAKAVPPAPVTVASARATAP